MTTTQYLRAFARFWWLIVICAVAGVGASFIFSASTPTTYRASADLVMAATRRVPQDTANRTAANSLAVNRLPTYAAAAGGTGLAEVVPASERSGASVESLAKHLEVDYVAGSTVLTVSATSSSVASARELAATGARGMERLISDLEDSATRNRALVKARVLRSPEDKPVETVAPSVWQAPLLCGSAGLLVGLGLAVALSRAYPRLRDRRVTAELVGAPVLGRLPDRDQRQSRRERSSSYTDAIDSVRSGLFFLRRGDACLIVAITPSRQVDRLADTAGDLAASIGATGARLLLIDADLDASASSDDGLAQHLSGALPLKGLVRRAPAGHHVVTAGSRPEHAADLLHQPSFATLLAGAANRYDYVLVVTSPADTATGATAVTARCDATVLIVPERSRARHLRRSLEALASVGSAVRGVILTR